MGDWLQRQAQEEMRRRVYTESWGDRLWRAFLSFMGGALILAVSLATLAAAAFFISKIGTKEYVLECTPRFRADPIGTSAGPVFLRVTEYGNVVKLWNKSWGSAVIEFSDHQFAAMDIGEAGLLLSLTRGGRHYGSYSEISGSLRMTEPSKEPFDGRCFKRPSI